MALDAVVGFVDLSGFTTATEALGRFGPKGTEQLGGLINTLFAPAIAAIDDADGEVGWFAGDAMGVLFDQSVTSPPDAVATMAEVSARITAMPLTQTEAGPVRLAVKVGIAAGPIRWQQIGTDHIVSWFAGPPVDLSAAAEALSRPGEIVVHSSVVHALGDGFALTGLEPDFHRLEQAPSPRPRRDGTGSILRRRREPNHQPPRIARLAEAGDLVSLNEHRPASSVFLRLDVPSHDAEQLALMKARIQDLGGFLAQVNEGDKGATALCLFGVPTSLADRDATAVHAAHQLRELAPRSSIGVTSGRVYAGRVGSSSRWDYSVVGDRVNTAARLMAQAAPGEILVDQATADGAGALIVPGPKRLLQLKGKLTPETVTPVNALATQEDDPAHRDSGLFVGRQAEVDVIRELLGAPGGLILITGAAGAGKTRLLGHLLGRMPDQRSLVVRVEQPDRDRPYRLWLKMLGALLQVPAADVLTGLPPQTRSDERLPLLGPVLGVTIDETPLTQSLGPDDRSELLASLLADAVRALGCRGRVLGVEDLHWADQGSLQLLQRLAGELGEMGLHVVATTRPDDRTHGLLQTPASRVVELAGIAGDAMADLATHTWRVRYGVEPPADLVVDLTERSGGSPLFCEQLVSYAHAAGVAADVAALPGDIGVPTTLTDLVLARLDALPDLARSVATYGAVLGRGFEVDDLIGAFSQLQSPDQLAAGVDLLTDAGVLEGLGVHRFAHSLFVEVAYERLSYETRARLHLAVLEHLERRHPDPTPVADLLAHHAESSNDPVRRRRYFRLAGDRAKDRYANELAARWYRQLVPLVEGRERGEIDFALGRIEMVSGDLHAAEGHLIHAVKDLGPANGAADIALAEVLVRRGGTAAGFDLLREVTRSCELAQQWEPFRQALDTTAQLATMLGDVERADAVAAHHARIGRRLGPEHPAAEPLPGLIPLHWLRGDLDTAAREYAAHQADREEAGDLVTAGILAADRAGIEYERGNIDSMFELMATARELLERVGNRRGVLHLILGNEVLVRHELGDDVGAASLAVSALQEAISIDDPRSACPLLTRLAALKVTADPRALLLRAVVLAESLHDLSQLDEALYELAMAEQESGRIDDARRLLQRIASGQGAHKPQADLALLRMEADLDPTPALLGRVSALAVSCPSPQIRIEALELRWRLDPTEPNLTEAVDAARELYAHYPSQRLRALIGRLEGVEPPRSLPLPPLAIASGPANLAQVVASVDRFGALADWRHDALRVVGLTIAADEDMC